MTSGLLLLAATAAAVGFIHTILGPDHYVPFIVLARARGWSRAKTALITVGCGVGHVLSSVVLGVVGIGMGVAVTRFERADAARASMAAWLLITLGLVYGAWGLHRALRHRGHSHYHFPTGEELHDHDPFRAHHHQDAPSANRFNLTPWVLFVAFALGPCEPLIPILMYPAATSGWLGVAFVVAVFAVTTLATMLLAVWVGLVGIDLVSLGHLERYAHALAGGAIFLSGLAVQLLGW